MFGVDVTLCWGLLVRSRHGEMIAFLIGIVKKRTNSAQNNRVSEDMPLTYCYISILAIKSSANYV